jgi:hypothetical protein
MAFDSVKRYVVAGAAALVLGGAAFGAVAAQQATPTPTTGASATPSTGSSAQVAPQDRLQAFMDAVAAKLGVTPQRLQQAIAEVRQEQGLPEGGRGPFGGHGHGHGHGVRMGMEAAATAIGITPEQLRTELVGKSLTQVAQAHNVDPDKVADALKAEAEEHLAQAVTDGRLTQAQADEKRAELDTKIDALMDRVFQEGGPRGRHHDDEAGTPQAGFNPRGAFGF